MTLLRIAVNQIKAGMRGPIDNWSVRLFLITFQTINVDGAQFANNTIYIQKSEAENQKLKKEYVFLKLIKSDLLAMDALGEHSCNDRCPCKHYGKLDKTKHPIISAKIIEMCPKEALEEHVDRLGDETWLAAHVEEGHSFAIGCIVCSELLPLGDRDVWGRFEITTVQALKPYRVKSHESSKAHLAAVMRLLQPSADLPAQMPLRHDAAPDGNSFQCLLQWVRKGQCLRDGIAGVGHFKKSRSMCFVLTESLRRLYRAQLSKCETINVLRDERHSRLLVRFRGATLPLG